jgi:membrane-associated protease RseP (regulator of RpoE activity)
MRMAIFGSVCLAAIALTGIYARAFGADPQAIIGATVMDSFVQAKGAFVSVVPPGGPASQAGLVTGNRITAVDGKPVTGTSDLEQLLSARRSGGKLALNVVHLGKAQRFTLVRSGSAPTTAVAVSSLAPAREAPFGTSAHPLCVVGGESSPQSRKNRVAGSPSPLPSSTPSPSTCPMAGASRAGRDT